MSSSPNVLVVDDDPDLASLYESWLSDDYTVKTARDGSRALEECEHPIDVVLLDRRMPGVSGDEVLEQIRQRKLGCRVAIITAVDPDFDILSLGFDAYLTKPVNKRELNTIVDKLLRRSEYTDTLQSLFSELSKREALVAEKSLLTLETDERYQQLEAKIKQLRQQCESHLATLDGEDFDALFHQLGA